jgi:hypothetical protein
VKERKGWAREVGEGERERKRERERERHQQMIHPICSAGTPAGRPFCIPHQALPVPSREHHLPLPAF